MSHASVTFEMSDGRELRCEYDYKEYSARMDEPSYCEADEPTFYLSDVEFEESALPAGLGTLAELMYIDRYNHRFVCKDTEYDKYGNR